MNLRLRDVLRRVLVIFGFAVAFAMVILLVYPKYGLAFSLLIMLVSRCSWCVPMRWVPVPVRELRPRVQGAAARRLPDLLGYGPQPRRHLPHLEVADLSELRAAHQSGRRRERTPTRAPTPMDRLRLLAAAPRRRPPTRGAHRSVAAGASGASLRLPRGRRAGGDAESGQRRRDGRGQRLGRRAHDLDLGQAGEELALVGLLGEPVVEDHDDAGVGLGTHEAAEPLAEASTASGR